jgi:hypothetical protein
MQGCMSLSSVIFERCFTRVGSGLCHFNRLEMFPRVKQSSLFRKFINFLTFGSDECTVKPFSIVMNSVS